MRNGRRRAPIRMSCSSNQNKAEGGGAMAGVTERTANHRLSWVSSCQCRL